MAVCSSSPAVAARCAHVRSQVGAVASQNITDPALGTAVLARIAGGETAKIALSTVLEGHRHAEYRQLLVVDHKGETACFTGSKGLGTVAEARGPCCVAGGNLLSNASIPERMIGAFQRCEAPLSERLMAAMDEAVAAGGEAGPVRSAGLLVADRQPFPIIDLRIDWDTNAAPITALRHLYTIYESQIDDYILRAESPDQAPAFGVPGDER